MTFRKILLTLILTCFVAANTYATDYTNFILSAGGGINLNSYTPNEFYGFPLYHDGNVDYGIGSGISWSAFVGAEYKLGSMLFDKEMCYVFTLGISNMSGEFSKEAPLAYSINDEDARLVTVSNIFTTSYSVILTEHSIATYLFDDLPFSLITGLGIGIPMSKSFDSKEEIVSPADVTFGDKSTVFNPISADIPDASGLYAALKLGVRYELNVAKDLNLVPEVSYNLALTKVAGSNDWKINRISANLALNYHLPVSYESITVGKNAPLPPIPLPEKPPVPEKLEYDIDVFVADNKIEHMSSLDVHYDVYTNVDYISQPAAKIYFKGLSTDYYYPESIKEIVKNSLNNEDVNLVVSYSNRTNKAIAERRLEKVKSVFKSINPKVAINSSFVEADTNSCRYKELYEELEYIEIVNKTNNAFAYKIPTRTLKEVDAPEFRIESNIIVDARPYSEEYMYQIDTDDGPKMYTLSSANIFTPALSNMPEDIILHGYIRDAAKREKSDNIKIKLNYIRRSDSTYINNISNGAEYYYLGFFDFDGKQFISVDTFALEQTRKAISEGKTVKIVPLTDMLGTEEYNQALAKSRAKAAEKLINSSADNLKVDYNYDFKIKQVGPLKRQLSRSVVVVIE